MNYRFSVFGLILSFLSFLIAPGLAERHDPEIEVLPGTVIPHFGLENLLAGPGAACSLNRHAISPAAGTSVTAPVIFSSKARVSAFELPSKPNIILINLDDADYRMFGPELLDLYPHISRLAKNSISFTNLHVTTPFCGPSRASLFRGQYAHRTGVRVNIPESPLSLGFKGGYREFLRNHHEKEELGVWMQRAGYRTMMIGKYHHNGFDFRKPPGWDDFFMSNGGLYQGTYRFTTRDDPAGANSRNPIDTYRTDQEASDAVDLIRFHASNQTGKSDSSGSGEETKPLTIAGGDPNPVPFFLYLAPLAPHRAVGADFTNMVDKKKYGKWQSDLQIPSTPDFDESQMSDKPLHRQSPPYSEIELKTLELEYVSRARAVKSVDDMLGRLMAVLDECGLTDSTYVLFTSDNGYQLGQHRLHNKLDPYQMCTNVPLFVSGPGIKPSQTANHLLAHIDICPTILELAGSAVPDFVDGKSFRKLLFQPESADARSWRQPVVIENWQAKPNRGKVLPGAYSGLRYYDQIYVEWVTGDKEFYDLAKDPFELENVYRSLTDKRKQQLKRELLASRNVRMNPLLTILPAAVETADSDPLVIRGYAEDDQRVVRVALTIQEPKSKEYWNGTSWGNESVVLLPALSANDQQIISWSYPVHEAMIQLAKRHSTSPANATPVELSVAAWASDEQRNVSEKISQTLTLAR